MRIDKIHITNFRGIEDLTIELNPHFNLLIGENGSGKTAILEAIVVGAGCFFSGIPGVHARHIRDEDIRYFKSPEGSFEYSNITKVDITSAMVIGQNLKWYKARSGITGSNILGNNSAIKNLSEFINKQVKDSRRTTTLDLPVIAYYSTARLWKEGRENKKDKLESRINLPSRYRAYRNSLEITSTFKVMLDWFRDKFRTDRFGLDSNHQFQCVKNVVVKNIPGAKDIRWIFDPDRIQTLYILFEDGKEIPFQYLSDGYRNLLSIFADLAYRCVTLNPHFEIDANSNSEGIVLIDELDLHLHPAWQQEIVQRLKDSFPKIQFIATTHSPFILQEMDDNEVYKINSTADDVLVPLKGLNRLGIEDIAEDVQNVETPNMSSKREEMFKAAEEYYQLLDSTENENNPQHLQELKDKLDSILEKYSDDVAYYAFLKQERLSRGI